MQVWRKITWVDVGLARNYAMAEMFSDSWNWKNRWRERIPNQKKRVQNWREHILRLEKYNSNENSGVQKVRNQKIAEFRGIPNGFPNLDLHL